MKCFFGTSALIQNYVEETGSETVSSVLSSADVVFVSEVTLIECFPTIRRLAIETSITEDEYYSIKDEIRHDFAFFTRIDIREAILQCEKLIDTYQLKTLDSIQLASSLCVRSEIESFVCCDQKLLTAAEREQLSTINPYAEEEKHNSKSLE